MSENQPRDKTIAIINTQAPFSNAAGKEALDAALIFGSYEQATSLFFLGDGVFQVIGDQNASAIEIKDYLKTFSALEFYDIENIYVCQQSLTERNLSAHFHINNIQVLSNEVFSQRLHQHNVIYRF
ncbi:sulfurtransferase complex subunit TusC [Colwellia sp. MB02u-18]|uniref:sulfurtransferase complex subunit TusC n=1 Tax=unclassified Colwellia TaxID=196834 RepID=UPI0015F47797|nr:MULTISPECIES: sulfurtransferase complex subunit TusC [unclassified Colwellia]MBA6224834.1 sulfurtransferase complex subunit TusC [Colwellia sp. MB3u-45]MBA6268878.1 sulfurtransferase complex subunit TusC [Colwellia sp. MB3u-43]MBA6321309.1 sulfurtransferase complex subunit TusC [Colwellia sp. MB02u-19]MBA6325862.1 sulfurtransferase complex subunit TusC [Colwellia sp. MB02u-18]MBA6332337.1 sulfurtransferase complex subunit TusC [Colwellia sp. MB02u-12]